MCINFRSAGTAEIEAILAEDIQGDVFASSEVWPGYTSPILRRDAESRKLILEPALFGLVPPFIHDLKLKKFSTTNARAETVGQRATFKHAWNKQQLCLVPMQLYFDPCYENGHVVRWSVRRVDARAFFVAGLWSRWRGAQHPEGISTFALLTVNADTHPQIKRLHGPEDEKRGLVQIEAAEINAWLTATTEFARAMLTLPDPDLLYLEASPQPPRTKRKATNPSPLLDG